MTDQPARSGLDLEALRSIQRGHLAYSYKGRPALKCPFDVALYSLVLWDKKPGTVIEVGSYGGGSALWLADQLRAYGSPAHVYSIDIKPVRDVSDPGVTFMEGDAEDLAQAFDAAFMASLPRPLLVIEDSSHMRRTSLAVMEFMDSYLAAGEMMIIEDAIVEDLGMADEFDGGPGKAIDQFLAERPTTWRVDRHYCDFFGVNFTWNINGYLVKIA